MAPTEVHKLMMTSWKPPIDIMTIKVAHGFFKCAFYCSTKKLADSEGFRWGRGPSFNLYIYLQQLLVWSLNSNENRLVCSLWCFMVCRTNFQLWHQYLTLHGSMWSSLFWQEFPVWWCLSMPCAGWFLYAARKRWSQRKTLIRYKQLPKQVRQKYFILSNKGKVI